MLDGVVQMMKITAKISFIGGLALAFLSVFIVILGNVAIVLNKSIIGDLIILIQQWAPFKLNVILAWAITSIILITIFKLAEYIFNIANNLLSS